MDREESIAEKHYRGAISTSKIVPGGMRKASDLSQEYEDSKLKWPFVFAFSLHMLSLPPLHKKIAIQGNKFVCDQQMEVTEEDIQNSQAVEATREEMEDVEATPLTMEDLRKVLDSWD